MDFVSRLKDYLSFKKISVTQFADFCNIPRPTVSQIINGRNKKISDEIISKIHQSYPDLSVYWLMFGEGHMLIDSDNMNDGDLMNRRESNISDTLIKDQQILNSPGGIFKQDFDNNNELKVSFDKLNKENHKIISTNKTEKTITKIVVFFSDNSYESYGPSQQL